MSEPRISSAVQEWPFQRYLVPLVEAVRRNLSRPHFRQVIAAAGLPPVLANVAVEVVRSSGLWRQEGVDVAQELCAHFQDGLSTGESIEKLLADFGPPRMAAKLIRQAKFRNRPLWWQFYHYALRTALLLLALIVLTYASLIARFYFSRPSISHNYWADINSARHSSEHECAWPLYREAIVRLGGHLSYFHEWVVAGRQGDHWGDVLHRVEQHRDILDELVRQGAQRPRLGLYAGDPADNRALTMPGVHWCVNLEASVADDNDPLAKGSSDAALVVEDLADLVAADARNAAIEGDGRTCLSDLVTMISMAQQLGQAQTTWPFVDQLVSFRIFRFAIRLANEFLADSPEIFSEAQLITLSDRIESFANESGAVDLSGHQLVFDDTLQRAFTDDGNGSGRITPNGLQLLYDLWHQGPIVPNHLPTLKEEAVLYGLGAGAAQVMESRQANRDRFASQWRSWMALLQEPPWKWDREAIQKLADSELNQNSPSDMTKLKYLPVALLFPPIYGVTDAREVARQERDATLAAVALIRWRRIHGDWPERIDQLVPDFLPEVPVDRMDGLPLRYQLCDGQPILYSVGADRIDGGGARPEYPEIVNHGFGRMTSAALKEIQADPQRAGDWILWPHLPLSPEEDPAQP